MLAIKFWGTQAKRETGCEIAYNREGRRGSLHWGIFQRDTEVVTSKQVFVALLFISLNLLTLGSQF